MQRIKSRLARVRFGTRVIVIVGFVVALALARLSNSARTQSAAVQWVESQGGQVQYDYQLTSEGRFDDEATPPGPKFLRSILGVHYFATPLRIDMFDLPVSRMDPVGALRHLELLDIADTPVSEIAFVSGLSRLTELRLSRTRVKDVRPLARLKALRTLYLEGTPLVRIEPLSKLSSLQELYLTGTAVSDVEPLRGLVSLRVLALGDTNVADLGALRGLHNLRLLALDGVPAANSDVLLLQRALPKCTILWDHWSQATRDTRAIP